MNALHILLMVMLTATTSYSQNPKKAETVSLNGTTIYYEVYGKGAPLLLLHGYTQSSASWLPFVSGYTDDFEVYLVDLKGHGKSGWFTEKLSIKSAALDLNSLITYLKLDLISAIGYSYGGDILFQLALLNPELIQSMITVGSCGSWNANDFPGWLEYLSYKNVDQLPWMRQQHTDEEQIQIILDQVPNYNIKLSDAELKSISAKTMMVIGDKDDSLDWNDLLNAKRILPNASLWVVPDMEHGAHRDQNKDNFIRVSREFLKSTPAQVK